MYNKMKIKLVVFILPFLPKVIISSVVRYVFSKRNLIANNIQLTPMQQALLKFAKVDTSSIKISFRYVPQVQH